MRNRSTRWIGILAGVIALAVAPPALAQEHGMRHGHDPEKRIEKMREALDLTDEQVVQVRAIFAEHGERLRALHQETHGRVEALLDDAQREKLQALHAEHERHREERGHGHDDRGGAQGQSDDG